ncbi:MAG TPA: molybdopterin-dependent oxidoreductase [Thermoanaerobaculia bacterium]|nr:molybdopterin-dependent oxidoreductase [Thermoanaerobaculia bacterium]
MSDLTRRDLIKAGAALAGGWAAGPWAALASGAPGILEPPLKGKLVGTVPFLGEPAIPFGETTGAGLSGRRAFDLGTLTAERLVPPSDRHFIHTLFPARLDPRRYWQITFRGHGFPAAEVPLKDLLPLAEPMGVHLAECVDNGREHGWGLISAAEWKGIPFRKIFERIGRPPEDGWVLVSGNDLHLSTRPDLGAGASWLFSPAELEAAGAFLATEMNGQPLAEDLGYPVRLVVPGWYACAWIKWVETIVYLPKWAEVTAHMREFTAQTFQNGVPRRAERYYPPRIEPAALPVRVERWRSREGFTFRIVGVAWGGARPPRSLEIRFDPEGEFEPVSHFVAPANTATWTLWSHLWRPAEAGAYTLDLQVDGSRMRSRRLSLGVYTRQVQIDRPNPASSP